MCAPFDVGGSITLINEPRVLGLGRRGIVTTTAFAVAFPLLALTTNAAASARCPGSRIQSVRSATVQRGSFDE
jgi:hypothetical protein